MDEIVAEGVAEAPVVAPPPRSKRKRAKAPAALKLPAELGIEQASALHAALAERIESPQTVVLDGADVQRVHTAVLQLFCLFCRDRRSAGRKVQWQQPSAALLNAAALLGVTTLLQIAQEEP
ncbi:MAG: STAS domain-containing protein [Nevskia sp.]|jgi:ABC-type transporter Mla MlaB component|nr:STAS domain-containing protein [Nevskia sp.]MCK9384095.1 STAS domain-containing protein [Nevskia sp.]